MCAGFSPRTGRQRREIRLRDVQVQSAAGGHAQREHARVCGRHAQRRLRERREGVRVVWRRL